jgi:hypothetical protein
VTEETTGAEAPDHTERNDEMFRLINQATVDAFRLLVPDVNKLTPEDGMDVIVSFAQMYLDAHRVLVTALTTEGSKRDDITRVAFTKVLREFMLREGFKQSPEERVDTARSCAIAASRAVLAEIPPGSGDALIAACHHSVLYQFAFVTMSEQMNARAIRATVDDAIRAGIEHNGAKRERAKEQGTVQ